MFGHADKRSGLEIVHAKGILRVVSNFSLFHRTIIAKRTYFLVTFW